MSVSIRTASKEDRAGELGTPDAEWRTLVTEAALASGVTRQPTSGRASHVHTGRLTVADPEDPSSELIRAIRAHTTKIDLDVTSRHGDPETALEAVLEGELVEGERAFKSSSRVDLAARELSLTCQTGQYSVHDAARSLFPPERGCAFGAFNEATAGVVASVPAHQLANATSARVTANLYVPVAYDNTLQRVWRLAVPSADMLLDDMQPHFAVVGVRGLITVTATQEGLEPVTTRREFLRRSLSAHAPSQVRGYGPVKGAHLVELDVPALAPERDLSVVVTVSLMSLLAGDPAAYRQGAPFYAGIDFGGNGTVRLPHECLSAFEIPLTPLIENRPITLSEISFTGSHHGTHD